LLSTFGFNFNLRRYIEAFEELVKGVLETPSLPRGRVRLGAYNAQSRTCPC